MPCPDKFEIFMIDPPWKIQKGGIRKVRPNQGRALDYDTMPVTAIFQLLDHEIFSHAAKNHCVFLWTIEHYLIESEKSMLARGYKRHCRFIWDKTNGIAPCFTVRYIHEYLVWYYKSTLLPVAKEWRGKYKTIFTEKAREHSRKPDFAYAMIESLYPGQARIDVFSREKRAGWVQYGDQTDHFKSENL